MSLDCGSVRPVERNRAVSVPKHESAEFGDRPLADNVPLVVRSVYPEIADSKDDEAHHAEYTEVPEYLADHAHEMNDGLSTAGEITYRRSAENAHL